MQDKRLNHDLKSRRALCAVFFAIIRKTQFYGLLVVYMVLATARPGSAMSVGYNDLVVHFVGYIVLYSSCLLAYGPGKNKVGMMLLLFAYSFLIELVQYTIPYRSFSMLDLLVNALGLGTGLITDVLGRQLLSRYDIVPAVLNGKRP